MIKEAFDRSASLVALALLSPVLIIIGILIRWESEGPALYKTTRMGKDFVPFKLYKFRTMVEDAEQIGPAITSSGDTRVTRLGALLRRYKLDELPQLINVIKGDMSLVGPRPEAEKYVRIFKDDYREILSVRPGITDFASLEFRDEEGVLAGFDDPESSYVTKILPEKILLNKRYILERNFAVDLAIVFRTLLKVLKG